MGPKFGHVLMKKIHKMLGFAEKNWSNFMFFGPDVISINKAPLYSQQILGQNLEKNRWKSGRRDF